MRKIAMLLAAALLALCCAGCADAPAQTEAPETEKIERTETVAEAPEAEEATEVLTVETPEAEEEPEFEVVLNTEEAETPEPEPVEPEPPAPEEPPEPDAPEAESAPAAPDGGSDELYINEFTVEDLVSDIRADYQDIVFDTTLAAEQFGDAATVFLRGDEIVSVTEYFQLNEEADPATQTVHYYYRDGEPFFVFITFEHSAFEEVRLYFYEGKLIRWIEDDAAPNDSVHSGWAEYYQYGLTALQHAKDARG